MALLGISCNIKNFAPTHESATIGITAPSDAQVTKMTLSVADADSNVVYSAEANGYQAQMVWDGTLNANNINTGTEPYATPLRSPFTITVNAETQPLDVPKDLSDKNSGHDETVKCSSKEKVQQQQIVQPTSVVLSVLYDSIHLRHGKWNADGQVFNANSAEDVCNRLNALGYYAGPPARCGTDATRLNRAKARFRRNSKTLYLNKNPSNQEYVEALTAAANYPLPTLVNSNQQAIASDTAFPNDSMRIFVEAPGFEGAEFDQQYAKENRTNRTATVKTRLNRPLVPIDAVIKLKASDGSGVDAPRAVGAVRVDFEISEGRENFDRLPFDRKMQSYPQTYVRQMLLTLADRGENNTNCPEEYGGIRPKNRDGSAAFWMEAQPYAPYDAPQKDGNVVYTTAYTGNVAACRGRAGVYFQPSIIAGDRYRVTARLKFQGGRANALALANPVKDATTQFIEVWRRTDVAAIIGWPPRAKIDTIFPRAAEHYEVAFTILDTKSTLFASISEVLTDTDYTDFMDHVAKFTPSKDYPTNAGKILDLTKLGQYPLVPRKDLKEKLSIDELKAFNWILGSLLSELGTNNDASPADWLLERLAQAVIVKRGIEHPIAGMLMLDYKHDPNVMNLGGELISNVPTVSSGLAEVRALVDQNGPGDAFYIMAHEVGHCFWLRHYQNAGKTEAPEDHDALDRGCMMSYTVPDKSNYKNVPKHQEVSKYRPCFCGKCNLKLRGWDIDHADFPKAEKSAKTLNFAVCYDASEPSLRAREEVGTIRNVAAVSRGEWMEKPLQLATVSLPIDYVRNLYGLTMNDSDVFHHISHGNVHCSACNVRALTMSLATPRYPTLCAADPAVIGDFCRNCGTLFSKHELETTVMKQRDKKPSPLDSKTSRQILSAAMKLYAEQKKTWSDLVNELATKLNSDEQEALVGGTLDKFCSPMLRPGDKYHPLRSVVQWTVDLQDSGKDLQMTYDDFATILKTVKPPRTLMFFSCCLMGWDSALAELFINLGTLYVIAFRSRYLTAQSLLFTKAFYETWAGTYALESKAIPDAFAKAATACPHAEPVLFSKNMWVRAIPETMKNGSGKLLTLKPAAKEFYTPCFPKL